ncbi:hypothetical protein ASG49_10935 [Marmoricola sp. Leaf446]|uniref:hypothetical protein n=1 Tax=Marmoricola sp. Leaf446 TaxID=1736379 RepID=UPI0006FCE305|nr:hypothetical protein [Marmoricola sp. Leaf446]KQT91530.1 hypothetical protein ASG49_10935 [Marmoricola sp. Leaf446]
MTDRRGAASPGSERARAAARRAVIRRHHPDVGGDPEVLRRELAAVDAAYDAPADTVPEVGLRPPGRWQPLARRATRARRTVSRGTRQLRSRLPPGWPGARRWTDI